jgi:branched-subunit amino acid ABC-type transport system permease component
MASRIVTRAIAVLFGLLLTWGTGMFPTPFARIQIDVVSYGAPLAYSTRIIPTEFITFNWTNLVLDVAFWAIIVYLILAVILRTSLQKKIE